MAIGEKPMSRNAKRKRAKHFFWGIMRKQMLKVPSKKTFKIADIPEIPPPYGEAW